MFDAKCSHTHKHYFKIKLRFKQWKNHFTLLHLNHVFCMLSHFIRCMKILFTKLIVCYNFWPWLISLSKKHGYLPIILYGCVGTHPSSIEGYDQHFFFLFFGGRWKGATLIGPSDLFLKHRAHPPNRSPEVIYFIALVVIPYLVIMVGTR
jgi:hypothetical protein